MAATLFLSPPPSNASPFLHPPNPNSDSYLLPLSISSNFFSRRKIQPIHSLNPHNSPSLNSNSFEPKTPNVSSSSSSSDSVAIKMPTAPWMNGPLLIDPNEIIDFSKPRSKRNSSHVKNGNPDRALTDKVSGRMGNKAMKKIYQSIDKIQKTQRSQGQKTLEGIEFGVSLEQIGESENSKSGKTMPWVRDERVVVFRRTKKEKVVTPAELSLDRVLLERLRGEAARIRKWVKVMKAGVTESVVYQIHLIWKNNELAMLKFDLPLCRNMDRAREILELKTGGLVVWCRKDVLVIYRGCNYEPNLKARLKMDHQSDGKKSYSSTIRDEEHEDNIIINGSLFEREADRLLDGLGPRFIDWWRPKPLPVDADLLPEVVPGFSPPSRLCPPHARTKLSDDELTHLRKLARPLPTHFVLGRNRKLQGLATAILKLWEKCYIAKIALKSGALNTNNEQMAYELKCLTGGVLLLRNKFFIILYRGKDFLPCNVANLIVERERELRRCQLQEEASRLKAVETFYTTDERFETTGRAGTFTEFQDIQSGCGNFSNEIREVELEIEAEKERLEKELRNQERKLFILSSKIKISARELSKLNSAWRHTEQDTDHEMIVEEERECYRKMGLKMDSTLVLGRRGVFDGVIEGLHQHWKHREIVKVITMQRVFSRVIYTAKMLERESGGLLVSVDKLKEGYAIILYRGKNYKRPLALATQTLLNKKEALSRSLELQRIGSLKFFAYQRQRAISDLKLKLADLQKGRKVNQENVRSSQARTSHCTAASICSLLFVSLKDKDPILWENGLLSITCHLPDTARMITTIIPVKPAERPAYKRGRERFVIKCYIHRYT